MIYHWSQLATHSTSALAHHPLSLHMGGGIVVVPVREILYKNKADGALKQDTRLEGLFIFTVLDLQSQSRKGACPSSGVILIQIHSERLLNLRRSGVLVALCLSGYFTNNT